MRSFVFQTTPRIVCEQGAAATLSTAVAALGASRVFMVTDRGVLDAGIAREPIATLTQAGMAVTVFSDVQADPPEAVVLQAVAAARAAGAELVIGFGGGSSMDTAKLVALLACTDQPLADIYGIGLARGPRLALIQVPSTAGTGSEVTPISIVTTPTAEKKGVVSPLLLPDVAVLDSLVTLGVPPAITAMTGVDAMVHAIEAYTSRVKKNLLSDTLAIQALQLLYANIRIAVADGHHADARENMLLGATLAGMAFANAPVAAVHALAYPLGGHFHLPHGLSNALMLTATLRFNLESARGAYAQLGRAIEPSLAAADDATAAERFVDLIAALVADMPFAQSLSAAGVTEAALPMLAQDAMKQQRLLVNNPRDVALADALHLYRTAY